MIRSIDRRDPWEKECDRLEKEFLDQFKLDKKRSVLILGGLFLASIAYLTLMIIFLVNIDYFITSLFN